jgi:curli biogenesis system outer membrane secretion channel CsgG
MKTKQRIFAETLGVFCISAALVVALGSAECRADGPSGSAGGAASEGSNQLERCAESLGTVAVVEDQQAGWYSSLSDYKLGSTVPVLKMMIQQSNCFVVVARGRAMRNMMQERDLRESGEMRKGSRFGKGQMVAADYTMEPSITFSKKGTGGIGGGLGGFFGSAGRLVGGIAGGLKSNEASTTLLLVDNRSGVQLAAAVGSAKNYDFSLGGAMFGHGGGGGLGGYTNTPEGKIITAAFMDSYNQLVRAVRNYQAQNVRGGLGRGGRLGVQGGQTPASRELGE